tara:strand:+ start:1306 stop:1656 length:351 start_codon:yes stop_codon:yes gene_type:complete
MAISHTETVSHLTILNNSDNIVSDIRIKTTSVDDSDPSNLNIDSFTNISFGNASDLVGVTTAVGFTTYSNLTENIVLGWVSSNPPLAGLVSSTQIVHEYRLNELKQPEKVDKALPW